ncbi:hypothetical protein BTM355_10210 [Helicobacter pylori]
MKSNLMGLWFILVTMFERVGLSTCGYNLVNFEYYTMLETLNFGILRSLL